jgi:hypothetical protein
MSKNEFETFLRRYLEHRPFQPFVVELTDGRRVVVKQPPVAYSDGAASFIEPSTGALVDFSHDEVRSFGLWEQEVPA